MARLLGFVVIAVLVIGLAWLLIGGEDPVAVDAPLVIAVQADAQQLDPHQVTDAAAMRMLEPAYEGLVRYGETLGSVAPALAESWSISDDGRSYTFTLVAGAQFHGGNPCDAAAVVASLERIRASGVRKAHLEPVTTIRAVGSNQVVLELAEPFAPLLILLAHPMNAVVDPAALAADAGSGDLNAQIAGTGPYQLAHWHRGEELALTAVAKWRDPVLPANAGLTFRVMPDESSRVTALRSGDIDVLLDVPAAAHADLVANAEVTVASAPGTFWEYLGFNCSAPPFDDLRVRQALAAAVDRQAIVDLVTEGRAAPLLAGPMGPDHPYGLANQVSPAFDPAAASAALAAAGASDLAFTLRVGSDFPYQVRTAQLLKQQFAAIGVSVTIESMESGLFFQALGNGDFEATVVGWIGFVDPDQYLTQIFHSSGAYNQQGFTDKAVDDLLDRGRRAVDEPARRAIYAEAQTRIVEQVPMIFLHRNPQVSAWRSGVVGMVVRDTASTWPLVSSSRK